MIEDLTNRRNLYYQKRKELDLKKDIMKDRLSEVDKEIELLLQKKKKMEVEMEEELGLKVLLEEIGDIKKEFENKREDKFRDIAGIDFGRVEGLS